MTACIMTHNDLAQKATLEERAERTIFFLKLARKTFVAPLDWPNDLSAPDRVVFRPLIEVKVVLTDATPNATSAPLIKGKEKVSIAERGGNKQSGNSFEEEDEDSDEDNDSDEDEESESSEEE